MLDLFKMETNITQLRKEAYKLWGIKTKEVVYDMPTFLNYYGKNRFCFKIDFSDGNESWPRSYKLSIPKVDATNKMVNDIYSRVIMPIILYKNYSTVKYTTKAWYDMPSYMHAKLLEITDNPVKKKLNIFQKLYNLFVSDDKKYKEIDIENNVYVVENNKNGLKISIK